MIGNNVELLLSDCQRIRGELRKLDATGAMIYIHEYSTGLKFYPMHRVLEIKDIGPVNR